jgi:F-type H+-transporting ATPase subunit beta
MNKGRIISITGVVIDVQFPQEVELPSIKDALKLQTNGRELVLEVMLQLENQVVRCVAMGPTDGLKRGMEVESIGGPIQVPVVKGRWAEYLMSLGGQLTGRAASKERNGQYTEKRQSLSIKT